MTPFPPIRSALLALAVLTVMPLAQVHAHGSMIKPKSRVVACADGNRENPTDPACAAAHRVSGSAMFYDWMSINQAAANGNHRAVVADGKLCSGGNPTFEGLNLARADWQAQPIAADANGRYEFLFKGTAPHATREWTFYVTRDGWNPNQPLRWADLEPFCTVGNTALASDGNYHLNCPLPKRSGRHVIYNTWQRSDSTEAFYTCMDVAFSGAGTPPSPTAWTDAGALSAHTALPIGTSVSLRVFEANGNDAERIEVTLKAGETAATAWPLRLGRQVNATARYARIGVHSNGAITPQPSASANRVFLSGSGRRYQLDIRQPAPNPNPNPNPSPGTPSGYDYVYPDGIGRYVPGATVVKGSDGKLYGCRPFPEGGWCNINADAYRPGTGYAWKDAWVPY